MEDKEKIPAVYGIPVILLNSSVKGLFEQWSVMKELFVGLQFYVDDLSKLQDMVDRIVASFDNSENSSIKGLIEKDINHFRQYFPDNSLKLCMDNLKGLLNIETQKAN